MNRGQKEVNEYMKKHNIERVISDMINTVVQTRDDKPLIFMVVFVLVVD